MNKYVQHENDVETVQPTWYTLLQERVKKACENEEELDKLEAASKEFSFQLCKEILQIVGKTAMLMAKAGKLFESELKTDIEEVQIPRNKEYLKDMMAVLIQYQENERRMKACRD